LNGYFAKFIDENVSFAGTIVSFVNLLSWLCIIVMSYLVSSFFAVNGTANLNFSPSFFVSFRIPPYIIILIKYLLIKIFNIIFRFMLFFTYIQRGGRSGHKIFDILSTFVFAHVM
jgi:hypothetical protein